MGLWFIQISPCTHPPHSYLKKLSPCHHPFSIFRLAFLRWVRQSRSPESTWRRGLFERSEFPEPSYSGRRRRNPEENGEKVRQLRSRCSKASTYVPVRLDLLAACGLAGELFHHSLEGRAQARMVLGPFAETKGPRRAGATPRI